MGCSTVGGGLIGFSGIGSESVDGVGRRGVGVFKPLATEFEECRTIDVQQYQYYC